MKNGKIKAIIFDIGGVMFANKKGDLEFLGEVFNVQYSEIKDAIKNLKDDLYSGKINSRKMLSIIKSQLKSKISLKDAYIKWEDIFRNGINPINRELFSIMEKLGEKYEIYIFTNTIDVHMRATNDAISGAKFKKIFRSNEEGVIKPNPEAFLYVANKIKRNPQGCVFVDDLKENIDGAISSGMNGIVFKNNEKFIFELEKLGVSI